MKTSLLGISTIVSMFAFAGCYGPGVESDPGAAVDDITNGNPASQFQVQRAARISGCTASIIGPRHLLTAAHCNPSVGSTVRFYTVSTTVDTSSANARTIAQVFIPAGVSPSGGDYTASDGDWADIAVVRLNADVPSTSRVAVMAWSYPGDDAPGLRVGSGRHDDESNPAYALKTNDDETLSSSDNDGFFYTKREETQPGDSGGPFYLSSNNRILGALYGDWYVFPSMRNRYTSVPEHLSWVLTAMGYTGGFTVTPTGGVPVSSMARVHASNERLCRYICANTTNCRAFSWVLPVYSSPPLTGPNCFLRESSSGAVSSRPGSFTGVL